MSSEKSNAKKYNDAKKKVDKLKLFYIHLFGYIVVFGLLIYNLLIIEDNEYTTYIFWLNGSTIVLWGIAIFIHGWVVFKGRFLFSKRWEDKRVNKYLEDSNKTKMWE